MSENGKKTDHNGFTRPVVITSAFLILAIAVMALMQRSEPGLYISEVCPHNEGILYDSIGFCNDFIVITNSSDRTVGLMGYGLSDDSSDLWKFTFPETILDPGESIMVYACNPTVFGDEGFTDDDAIYTGFKISDHEMIYLTDPKGVVIDSLKIPNMDDNEALVRNRAGDRGTVGRSVYDRTENADPTVLDSVSFSELSQTPGYVQGTYTVSIVSDPEGLFSDERGIYVEGAVRANNIQKAEEIGIDVDLAPANYLMSGKGWRRDAHLTLYGPGGECLYDEDDIISIRGRTSRNVEQKGFNIRLGEDVKKVFDGLFPDAGDMLMLRTGSTEDVYLTNFRDVLDQRIAKNLNVCTESAMCCQVFLNGQYWGCYSLQEHLDESFIAAKYGVDEDNVNIVKYEGAAEAESGRSVDLEEYLKVERFAREHDLSNDSEYARFCDMVDIDSLIDYYCAEIFFANDDAYFSNYGLWRVRTPGLGEYEDGKWRFILYDLDNTDGYSENTAASVDSFVEGSYIGYNAMDDRLLSHLSENAGFRKKFRERFGEFLANDFSYDNVEPMIDDMANTYKGPMVQSLRKYRDPDATEEDYLANVEIMREFFKERGGYISGYLTEHMGD